MGLCHEATKVSREISRSSHVLSSRPQGYNMYIIYIYIYNKKVLLWHKPHTCIDYIMSSCQATQMISGKSLKSIFSPSPCFEWLRAAWFGSECAWWSCPSTKASKVSVQTIHVIMITMSWNPIEKVHDDWHDSHKTQGPSTFPYPIPGFNDHPPQYPICLGYESTHMKLT